MDQGQIARLEELAAEHRRLLDELGSPEVASDHQRYSQLAKQAAEHEEMVRLYGEYKAASEEGASAREMLADASSKEDQEFLRATVAESESKTETVEARLQKLLVPHDPRDDRGIIVEIRAGAGGDEASLFAGELMRMYERYAERKGWKTEVLEASEGSVGGIKEAVFELDGKGAFSALRHESGVHRVQRVPETESSGRIHTSTVTVAVLPIVDEVDVDIDRGDLVIETYRASGPGGQHVNTTDSAVRIKHEPTGLVVTCQSERSQRQNMDRAMRILLAKLKDLAEAEAHTQLAAERRSQVGTGDRSEKIRTYNFPQNRVTDHRIGLTAHGIQQIMDGDIDEIVDGLKQAALEHAPS
ncbi:MAG: peptide chain release factor 1 [Actinomycetota bacterium]